MKIAFLTTEYPHPKLTASGGIGTSIFNLSKGLLKAGHEVLVIAYGQKEDAFFTENGISFYLIKNQKIKGLSRLLTQKKIERLINKLVSEKKIDILEAPDWTGITSNIKPNCPVVIRLHGSDTYFCHLDQRPVKWLNRYHEKKALLNADGLLSVSQYTAKVTQRLFGIQRNFTVIPNGIDTDIFSNKPTDPTDANTILYFGTLIRKKGLLELPLIFNKVYQKNNKARLVLVGRDTADIVTGNQSVWQMMQSLFDEKALQNVSYLGSVDYSEIKTLIAAATICVFPTFAEALPVSWIEAMALDKAVVASDIGWAPEIIDNGIDGFLANPKDHVLFAEHLLNLMQNDELRKNIGSAARAKVLRNFSIEVVAQQSLDFYQQLLQIKH